MMNLLEKNNKCPYCGDMTSYTDMCDGCWHVVRFIDNMLKQKEGRTFIKKKLKEHKKRLFKRCNMNK